MIQMDIFFVYLHYKQQLVRKTIYLNLCIILRSSKTVDIQNDISQHNNLILNELGNLTKVNMYIAVQITKNDSQKHLCDLLLTNTK